MLRLRPFFHVWCCVWLVSVFSMRYLMQICDCYQISDGEHKNRLLVLVSSAGTHALFAFATTNWPPEFFSDLHVASVYRVDELFRIDFGAFFRRCRRLARPLKVVLSYNGFVCVLFFLHRIARRASRFV